ncbi:hypothetical protein BCR32DRAFT_278128 [Anaeromyces robustus]|uniref:Uncharacterized protein n=1 Tax=Anaeromyces robustus TaxID=1754192 RepID=A0A1Y1XC98_9FUNG|nr:hypothetical protein BCR32DRAFT_278128 [Anaeromyces robustus]|eukprot:ORX83342.1 hypothetical protein BCR32DRAFT_278128 [Anaeromyces robustus]
MASKSESKPKFEINKFLWYSEEKSVKICSIILMLISISLMVIDIYTWIYYNYIAYFNYMISGAIFVLYISIIPLTISFLKKLKENKYKSLKEFENTIYCFMIMIIFKFITIFVIDIYLKFLQKPEEDVHAYEIFEEYKLKHNNLSNTKVRNKMQKSSLINISILFVITLFIVYYYYLIKTFINKRTEKKKE